MRKLKELFDKIHNKRPLLWAVLAFVIVVVSATAMSVWWNVLLVQNHHILRKMTLMANQAAQNPREAGFPLALFMVLGILCSLVILAGLLYFFLRLIKTLQLNVAQSQFIAAVTHELRSPVTSLQILLETIRDPATPQNRRIEFEECMSNDLKRLSHLVDQVLDTARLENVISPSHRETISVGPFLKNVLNSFNERFKAVHPEIRFYEPSTDLAIRAHKRLLTSALENVLENALKYAGQENAKIVVRVLKNKKNVLIEVEDQGIGMPRKEQKRVFKRFYRSGNPMTQSKPGTGLGLYFSKLALRSQGGNLIARSPGPGRGSTFTFQVPTA